MHQSMFGIHVGYGIDHLKVEKYGNFQDHKINLSKKTPCSSFIQSPISGDEIEHVHAKWWPLHHNQEAFRAELKISGMLQNAHISGEYS